MGFQAVAATPRNEQTPVPMVWELEVHYVAVMEPDSRKSVICHIDTRESFSEFNQAPSDVSFLCQSMTDFDRFFVSY